MSCIKCSLPANTIADVCVDMQRYHALISCIYIHQHCMNACCTHVWCISTLEHGRIVYCKDDTVQQYCTAAVVCYRTMHDPATTCQLQFQCLGKRSASLALQCCTCCTAALVWCRTMHDLAITYHFQSPWENHHLAASLRLLLRPEHGFYVVRHDITNMSICCWKSHKQAVVGCSFSVRLLLRTQHCFCVSGRPHACLYSNDACLKLVLEELISVEFAQSTVSMW